MNRDVPLNAGDMKCLFIRQDLSAQFVHLIAHDAVQPARHMVGISQGWAVGPDGPGLPRRAVRVHKPHRRPGRHRCQRPGVAELDRDIPDWVRPYAAVCFDRFGQRH